MEGISSLWFQGWNSFVVYRKQESKMKRNRKYWKTSAKAALRGNWIIAIAGMLAYMAVNFLDRDGIRYRIQLYDVEYEQRQGVQPWKSSVYVS